MTNQIHMASLEDCWGTLHPRAVEGLILFNKGKYWHAHEALEKAWLEERGKIRDLYRGILQVGVVYFHIQRGNYTGALKVYVRSLRWLESFPDICRGIDVRQVRHDLDEVIRQVRNLGPDRMNDFDESLIKPVVFDV